MPEENEIERKELKREGIAKLREMFKEQDRFNHFQIDDVYFERYLYSTEFDVDAAFTKMKMFYEGRLDHPDWYRIISPLDFKPLIEKDIRIMLPECDKEGRPIYIHKLGNINVRTMDILDVVAVDDIWLESMFSSNPHVIGQSLCVIMDIAHYPWNMIKWLTPEYIKQSLKKIHSLPLKDFKIHIINNSTLIHAAIKIVWPFLPEHIKQTVKFHFDNRDSLFEHIDPKVLPLEYGGTNNVDFNEIYSKLYARNEEIHTSFKLYRTINN